MRRERRGAPHLSAAVAAITCAVYCDVTRHLYIHVPFCARRCSYCDFAIAIRRDVPVQAYLAALRAELAIRQSETGFELDTVYLGGGTPSRLGGPGVSALLDIVRQYFSVREAAEITIEANPDDVTPDAVTAWRAAGVNRMSLGAQSFSEPALEWMHRTHGAAGIATAVEIARAGGIAELSLDLIFSLPSELDRDLAADLDRLVALAPDHVSLYGLTVEPFTPLGRWVARGVTVERDENGYEDEYLLAHERLVADGLEHYEVSNYGRPGGRAIHNSAYWSGAPYLGVGPSSHGFDGAERRWNVRHYEDWRASVAADVDPVGGREHLTPGNRVAEQVYLGLRTTDGLALMEPDRELAGRYINAGWMTLGSDDRLRCTPLGWLRLDGIAAALTHARSR